MQKCRLRKRRVCQEKIVYDNHINVERVCGYDAQRLLIMIEMRIVKGQSILYRDSTKEYAVVGNAVLLTGKAFYIDVTVISIKK
jgi:hypothetical protein